jgi:hypothetical protein
MALIGDLRIPPENLKFDGFIILKEVGNIRIKCIVPNRMVLSIEITTSMVRVFILYILPIP